jgi:integrase
VEYFDEEFLRGANGHLGHRILAAYMAIHPEFGPFGYRKLPRAHRALKGWDRLAPGYARTPDAFPVWAAIAVRLNARGHRAMGFWVLVAFGTYMRPGENHGLRVRDLLPPANGISASWGFLIRSWEAGTPNKVGEFDSSVLWDSPHLAWVGAFFRELRSGRRLDELLWPFSAAELQKQFRGVTVELGLPDLVPYQLRHSGASWDRLQGYRVLAEVKKRGSWKADRSVARYEKATRVLAEWHKLGAGLKAYCEMCDTGLERLMTRGAVIPFPPAVPKGGSWRTSSRGVAVSAPKLRR